MKKILVAGGAGAHGVKQTLTWRNKLEEVNDNDICI